MTEPGRWPDFFLVGAPKCGTTAMYSYLRQHPQIYMPLHKEPHYFGDDLTRRYGRMGTEAYLALFARAAPDQRAGEASTWYLYSRSAAREIKALVPDAMIVIMLRNPIEVMQAQHSQLLFNGQEDLSDFVEALAAEPERKQGRRLPRGPIRHEVLYYRETVAFAEQVDRYLGCFGANRVHVILHDDLNTDLAGEYRRLLGFLGVEPDFTPDFIRANERKRARSRLIQRLIYDPPIVSRLAPALRRFESVHRLRNRLIELNSRQTERGRVEAEFRARLAAELEPEVTRLGQLLGRDLGAWLEPTPGPGSA